MKKLKTFVVLSVVLVACAALKPTDSTPVKTSNEPTPAPVVEATTTPIIVADGDEEKWVAPAEADAVKNPIATSEESTSEGLLVYKKNCRSCHGKLGNGQGVGAADCKVPPADFTNADYAKQTDGAIQWKILTGKGDMKSYKGELDDEEMWNVINYIRTFSKKAE